MRIPITSFGGRSDGKSGDLAMGGGMLALRNDCGDS
jgi:hypothetical protein